MSEEQLKLFKRLWAIANELRGKMDASEFKNYMLGFIFYKFLSEKITHYVESNLLVNDKISFAKAYTLPDYPQELEEKSVNRLGYFLAPQYLFATLYQKSNQGEFILDDLGKAFKTIEESTQGHGSQDDFVNLFDDVDLSSSKLGKTSAEKNNVIASIIKHLDKIDFQLDNANIDILGDAYEYLIGEFAAGAGKKAGEFYTPQQVSTILAKLVTVDHPNIKNAYDPTCGSGSLLLRISKEAERVGHYTGQELNQTTHNLARMNMFLHGIKYKDFDLIQGDTLEVPHHIDQRFDVVVANPPFSAHWNASKQKLNDDRFSAYGRLAPKTKADFAFVQHMIYQLSEDGTMAVVLPHGVLFRGAAEGTIRQFLIAERNYLDGVIGLPPNLFFGTSIPTCVLVFKKCRVNSDNIFFIDASKEFEKRKNQNYLTHSQVDKIITTYKKRQNIDKYAYVASLDEIKENDYNLNIPRYVDTFEAEEPIDLDVVCAKLATMQQEAKAIDAKIKGFCDELGIKAPIF